MTTQRVKEILETTGIPVAYLAFTNETARPCPFICYFYAGDDDFLADNSNYVSINRLIVELYTDYKDFTLEKKVEETLNAAGFVFSREESYINTEQMFQIVYESEVIING